jgi:hypothetical protein
MFFEGHKNLRTKGTEKLFRNFGHIFLSKNIYLSFFITHFRHFRAPYIYNCSLQRTLSFSIKIIGMACKRMKREKFDKKN